MYQEITILGNVGADPEMRYTQSGTPVVNLPVAVNKSWTDKNGERKEEATWFKVTCWAKTAELVQQYVTKGQMVLVVGEMKESEPWEDRNGKMRSSLELTAQTVRFVSRGGGNSEEGGGSSGRGGGRGGSNSTPKQGRSTESQESNAYEDDEDIPF